MEKSSLQHIIEVSYSYSNIIRDMHYPDPHISNENDSEHSFQLCLLAWYIIEKDKLPLDLLKVLKMCLSHDLMEIYSGDVPLWGNHGHEDKEEKEKQAIETLESILGDSDIINTIIEYKHRETEEAKFAYGLDKLAPFLNQLNTKGRIWKKHNIPLDRILNKLGEQSQYSAYLKKYFDESLEYFKTHAHEYVGQQVVDTNG